MPTQIGGVLAGFHKTVTRRFFVSGVEAQRVRDYGCTSNVPTSLIASRGSPRWSLSTSHMSAGITSMATPPGKSACVLIGPRL